MIDPSSSTALRQTRMHLKAAPVLAGLVGVSVVLALSGPFRTLELLGPVVRTLYWTAIVFGTYATGVVVSALLGQRGTILALPTWAGIAASSVIVGIAVSCVIGLVDLLILGTVPASLAEVLQTVWIAIVISLVPVSVAKLIKPPLPVVPPAFPARPALLLDRLPFEKQGQILGFSVQDHYVDIMTSKGRELVLMRLADAIREAGDLPGLQVHRSHWVATGGVTGVRRTGETAILTLSNGTEVPVSRRYIKDLRQAGLLPLSAPHRVR